MIDPRRGCAATNLQGGPCGSPPPLDSEYCLWHDPERTQEAAEARRIGGSRRRREVTLAAIYDIGELDSVASLRRYLGISALDLLPLDNSVGRNRAMVSVVLAGAKLLEVGELEARIEAIEAAHESRRPKGKR